MMGDLSGLTLSTRQRGGTDSFSSKTPFKWRDAPMVSGFDLIGHNRTFQIHWVKRVVAFFIDLVTVFAPLWSFLYLEGIRQPWIYGVLGGFLLFAYSTAMEAAARCTLGKFILGLEVRSLRGPMTFGKAALRNFPKLFWFAFPLLDTLAGLVVDGDPRQRRSDKILGTTVAQSHLIDVRVQRLDGADTDGR